MQMSCFCPPHFRFVHLTLFVKIQDMVVEKPVNANLKKSVGPSHLIAHLGVGGFSRAHQMYCLHLLKLQSPEAGGGACDWGYLGVGLKSWDQSMYKALSEQDFVYTCNMRDAEKDEVVIVESICGYAAIMDDAVEMEKVRA